MLDIFVFNTDQEKTEKTVASVTGSRAFAEDKIRIYVFDFCDVDGSGSDANGKITHVDAGEMTDGEAYNTALTMGKNKYKTFITSDIQYGSGAIDRMMDVLKAKPAIASFMPVCDFGEEPLPYLAFNPAFDRHHRMNIDLQVFPADYHICFAAYVFGMDALKGIRFDEELSYDCSLKALLEILDREKKYTFVDAQMHYSTADERDFFSYLPQFEKSWYIDSMSDFLENAAPEGSSEFRQRFVLYLIGLRYSCNMSERDKSVLSPDEVAWLIEKTGNAVRYIDDELIVDYKPNNLQAYPQPFVLNLMRMKYNDPELVPQIICTGQALTAYINNAQLWSAGGFSVNYRVIYFDGENLTMDGVFTGAYVFNDDIEITAVLNESEIYPVRRNHIYALTKYFNVSAKCDYTFQFSIPESRLSNGSSISFRLVYKGKMYSLGAKFPRPESKLGGFAESYWVFNQHILTYDNKTKCFMVEDLTKKSLKDHEKTFLKAVHAKTPDTRKYKMPAFRLLYWATKPFYKKKIWITQDKLFKAGDNGEYFYRYAMQHKPADVQIYYVVNQDSPDYNRLKKEFPTIIKFNSLHHKLLALHTDLMLATHVDTMTCNGFMHDTHKYFKDIYNARVCCLAHGLTIQKIAQYQSRTFDNTVLYFFASRYEVENVKQDAYDYYDESALKLTGHARYDGLVSNDQRIILITPTWRRGTTTGAAKKGRSYAHSDSFKSSEYYKIYNGLISDDRLLACAKKNNYRIVYLLHPAMSSQLPDYEAKEGVEIVAATSGISYEKILTESSLMVTDYSGVQFDFAYMKKPLVYYHPDSLPPQYESSGLVYETMGFGPICRNHEQIIDQLCEYMDGQCKMEPEYQKRVDDFFQYSDHDNCARIFEEVVKFQNKFDKVTKMNYKK